MDKLQLRDDSARASISITGKRNPEDDAISLKVQIVEKNGSARNVYFPFDMFTDTPIDVAKEMVKELDITDWDPSEIASMIEAEISMLLSDRTNSYLDDENNESPRHYHHFPSVSSCSSSQESLSGAVNRADDISNGYRWQHEDMFDDASSQCSSHGTYSDLNFSSADDQYHNMASTRTQIFKYSKFSHGEDQLTLNRCKMLARPQEPSTSECEKMIENRILTRNKSLIDMRSQLLHRSLVEEVNKRRLFKTVGAVEDIGYQIPYKITSKKSQPVCDKEVNMTLAFS